MSRSIFLCASMYFYKDLVEIENKLVSKGFKVNIPVSAQKMKKNNDFEVSHFKDVIDYEQKGKFIHKNFKAISESDAILVVNNKKNGVKGYIGANVLMEIAVAYYFRKKIYILNPIAEISSYREELLSFGVKIINNDINKIH